MPLCTRWGTRVKKKKKDIHFYIWLTWVNYQTKCTGYICRGVFFFFLPQNNRFMGLKLICCIPTTMARHVHTHRVTSDHVPTSYTHNQMYTHTHSRNSQILLALSQFRPTLSTVAPSPPLDTQKHYSQPEPGNIQASSSFRTQTHTCIYLKWDHTAHPPCKTYTGDTVSTVVSTEAYFLQLGRMDGVRQSQRKRGLEW